MIHQKYRHGSCFLLSRIKQSTLLKTAPVTGIICFLQLKIIFPTADGKTPASRLICLTKVKGKGGPRPPAQQPPYPHNPRLRGRRGRFPPGREMEMYHPDMDFEMYPADMEVDDDM